MIPREDVFGCVLAIVLLWQTLSFFMLLAWAIDSRGMRRSVLRVILLAGLSITFLIVVGFAWPVMVL